MKHSLRVTDLTRHASISLEPRSTFVCYQCRRLAFASTRRARVPPPLSSTQRRFASGSWTESLRKKIWGTDNPPGQKDPYNSEPINDRDEERDRTVTEPQEAPPEQASTDTGDYVPALTWDGLDQVGGKDQSWEESWDQSHPFESFMAPTKMDSREEISEAIHRALVEIFTLKEAGISMEIFMGYQETPEAQYFRDVSFKQAKNGNTNPIFAYKDLREEILDSLTEVEENSKTSLKATVKNSQAPGREQAELIKNDSIVQAETESAALDDTSRLGETDLEDQESTERGDLFFDNRPNDETWLNVSFSHPKTKFAIIKRVMQLTGVRIPDPSINDINSAKALLGFLVKKPKPKKLAQSLMADDNLKNLPNIKILDRRYTPIDKDKQVGRWKVIEKELMRHGLPVTGHYENPGNRANSQ